MYVCMWVCIYIYVCMYVCGYLFMHIMPMLQEWVLMPSTRKFLCVTPPMCWWGGSSSLTSCPPLPLSTATIKQPPLQLSVTPPLSASRLVRSSTLLRGSIHPSSLSPTLKYPRVLSQCALSLMCNCRPHIPVTHLPLGQPSTPSSSPSWYKHMIHRSICLSIHPSIYLSINSSIYPSINSSIYV